MWGESVTSRKCEVKGKVCEVSLGQRGGSSYAECGKGMRTKMICRPATSQILGPPGSGYRLSRFNVSIMHPNDLAPTCVCWKFQTIIFLVQKVASIFLNISILHDYEI